MWRGVVRFFWDGLPHKPGFHQTTFCSRKSYWIILNLNFLQSQFVCLCLCILKVLCCVQVGWVSPRTGLPPFLPSSLQLAVLDTTCYKALPSASKLLDSRLLEVKLKNLSWSYTNMPPEYCCLFFVWALALQVCHVVCIFITTV